MRCPYDSGRHAYETASSCLRVEVYAGFGINTRGDKCRAMHRKQFASPENTRGHHGAQEDGNLRNARRRSVLRPLAISVLRGLIYRMASSHRARAQPYLNGYERDGEKGIEQMRYGQREMHPVVILLGSRTCLEGFASPAVRLTEHMTSSCAASDR